MHIQKIGYNDVVVFFSCQVICVHDVTSIYRVPLLLQEQKVVEYLTQRLQLAFHPNKPRKFLLKWKELADAYVDECF